MCKFSAFLTSVMGEFSAFLDSAMCGFGTLLVE